MHYKRRGLRNLGLGLLIGGLGACGQQSAKQGQGIDFDSAGFEGIDSSHFDLLRNTCSVATAGSPAVTTATVTVGDGEFAYVFLRATDNNVVVNANNAAGTECIFPATAKISVVAEAGGGASATHKILFDFLSGTFAMGTTAAPNGIDVSFATGKPNMVEIRGSNGVDQVTFGSDATYSYASYAINGAATHAFTDMRMLGVTDVVVSTGPADDIITGQGAVGLATNALSNAIAMTVYGGDGNDVITSGAGGGLATNKLYGNAGSDRFPQLLGVLAHDVISGGSGPSYTYAQTTVTRTSTSTSTTHLTATGTSSATNTGTSTAFRTLTATNSFTATYVYTQTDISVDVVDYSTRTTPVRVTVGDDALPVAASSKMTVLAKTSIVDHERFTLAGTVYEYHNSVNTPATGSITFPTLASALVNNSTFTINDGTNTPTVFELVNPAVLSGTLDPSVQIDLTGLTSGTDVAGAALTVIAAKSATLTVTPVQAAAKITFTNSAGLASGTFIATGDTTHITVVNNNGIKWVGTSSAFPIDIHAASGGAAGVAAATVAAINAHSSTVTATYLGPVVTVTANVAGLESDFTIAKTSGLAGFTIVKMFAGVATAGANDGDFSSSYISEADSIAADVEMVIGSKTDDYIDASAAALTSHILQGMSGNDTLIIAAGSLVPNFLYGGPGDDSLQGGAGLDTLYGGDGNDALRGGLNDDVIDGGNVNCLVASPAALPTVATPAKAAIYASALCVTALPIVSTVGAGAGKDTLDYSDRTNDVIANLATLATASQVGEANEKDSVTNCVNLRGGAGKDTLTGDASANMIWGGAGDDTISGGDGSDTIYGEAGDDTLSGDGGDDYIYGGTGINTIYGDTHGDATVVGNDLIDNSEATGGIIDCGPGDMDVLVGSGTESPAPISCEM